MTHKEAIEALTKNGVPLPDAEHVIEEVQYRMGRDDWYFRSQYGWYWLDARKGVWKPTQVGPL